MHTPAEFVKIDSVVGDANQDGLEDKLIVEAPVDEKQVSGRDYWENIDQYKRRLTLYLNTGQTYKKAFSSLNTIPCFRCNEPGDSYAGLRINQGKILFKQIKSDKCNGSIYECAFEGRDSTFTLTSIHRSDLVCSAKQSYALDYPVILLGEGQAIAINNFDIYTFDPDGYFFTHKGFVHDSDGYVNVREERNTKSAVIGKVMTGEKIKYHPIIGDWWIVLSDAGLRGFVHKSRIQEVQ